MEMMEWIQLIAGGALLIGSVCVFLTVGYGFFHFKYVLNRMHAAAVGDTLGIGMAFLGLIILNGFHFTTFKMLLILLFFWCASPVSSHMLARLEAATNEKLAGHCKIYGSLSELETEIRNQEAEDGNREAEDGNQEAEDGNREAEDGNREAGSRKAEDGNQKKEARKQAGCEEEGK